MVALTIGLVTNDDYNGIYFTLQALRLYEDLKDTELLVVDAHGSEETKNLVGGWAKARYVLATDTPSVAALRDLVFQEAAGDAVLCCDARVHFFPGVIAKLKDYYHHHPVHRDLLQGPLVSDDLTQISTHFVPQWEGQRGGSRMLDPRGTDPDSDPFEISMQDLGVFSCRKGPYPGFPPRFRGFGGEDGYLQDVVRRNGGRCLCLPFLRWVYGGERPVDSSFPFDPEFALWNYAVGHGELGIPLAPALERFAPHLPADRIGTLLVEVASEPNRMLPAPPAPAIDPQELYGLISPPNDVLVIVPTRGRPESSVAFAENLFAHSTRSDLVFGLDDDDPAVYPRIPGVMYEVNPRLKFINTLNLLANTYKDRYTYLMSMGDDNRIRTLAWDQHLVGAIEHLQHGVAYGNDLFMRQRLPTAGMVNASIVRTLGYMAPPALVHLYADNFWLEIGKGLDSIRYLDHVIIEHMHFTNGKSEPDTVYLEANSQENLYGDAVTFRGYMRDQFAADVALLREASG